MRKNVLKLFILVASFMLFPSMSQAELTCDPNVTYNIQKTSCELLPLNGGYTYGMSLYTTTLNGSNIKTYCIEPALKSGVGANHCVRRIDPTNSSNGQYTQAYDVAVTRAYQILTEDGRNTTSTADRVVGEMVFRWLGANYGQMTDETNAAFGASQQCGNNNYILPVEIMVDMYRNPNLTTYWNTGDANYEYAKSVFQEAMEAGNKIIEGKTFEQVVAETGMWTDQYSFNKTTESRDGVEYVTIDITLTNDVQNVYWSQFKGGCSNNTVKCTTFEASGSGNTGKVVIQVAKAANYDGQDYGIYIDSSIYDIRSSSANMIIVQGNSSLSQRMLLVADGSSSIVNNPSFPSGGGRHSTTPGNSNGDTCTCDESTGTWIYQRYQDGNRVEYVTWKETDSNFNEMMQKYQGKGCPTTCSKKPDKHVCEVVGDQHYCEDGEPCDEDEYIRDCLCNPVVTIPSDCDDFDTEDVASGYISDIATTGKNCNNSNVVDQIKKCVIGNKDARDESYEATNELSGNPYCKVWCSESYDFDLPTAQYSTSGGYFTLSTSISGKRDCYISSADDPNMPIDEEKFNQDLTAAQHAVIDAYNEFSYWKSAIEAEVNIEERQTNEGTCEESGTDSEGNPITTTRPGAGPRSYTYVWIEWEAVQYNYDGTRKSSNRKGRYTDGSGSCGCSSCDIDNGEVPKSPLIEIDPDNLNIDTDEDGEPDINIDTNGDGTPDLNIDTDEDNICDYKCDTNDDGNCDENCESTGEWNDNYTNAKNTLVEAINNLNTIISQYNSCTGVITNGTNSNLSGVKDASSTADTSWDNDMEFNPTVKFTYNEDYIKSMSGEFDKVSDNESSNYMYCTGDTNDKYECQSGSSSSIPTTTKSVLTCDENGCTHKNYTVSSAKWIRKTKTHDATYRVADRFSTYTQYGTVKVDDDPNTPDYLWTNLPEGAIPVSLIQKTGVFPFKFTFGNIGQSNSIVGENGLGRLIDNETSNSITVDVLSKYNELDSKYKCSGGSNSTTDGGYVCHYLNNCPGCDFTCDDDGNCEFDDCEDGHCILECPNCIFDGENSNYSYRTVSLNRLFPNSRDIGYNWSATSKAEQTRKEIEENGETIYETPQYSYTLTPTNLKNIREYNDKAGSYTNNRTPEVINGEDSAIYCETETINGKQYSVKCKSRFLDLLDNSRNYASNVVRPNPNDNSSWTLYSNTDYCPNGRCITNGLGPAWK